MTSPHLMPSDWGRIHGWNFWSDYELGIWEPETRTTIEEYVTPGSTYLDIGAWIGPTVLWAAPLAGRVVALEPDPVAYQLLCENTAHFTNVEPVRGAVASTSGVTDICPRDGLGFGSSMSRIFHEKNTGGWAAGEPVPCWTVPDLFDAYELENVSLVKMDIEGGEAEILETVCPYLAALKIPFLCSLHPDWALTPILRSWFDCFATVRDVPGGALELLAIP